MPNFPQHRKAQPAAEKASGLVARWEAATGSRQTQNHFGLSDTLGPNSAMDPATTGMVRRKARYERQNSPVLSGLVRTLSTSLIGTGPRARVGGIPGDRARKLENAWKKWCKWVGLTEKSRLAVESKYVDGEGFIVAVRDPSVPGPVKLNLVGYEAEQIGPPGLVKENENEFNGVRVDSFGRPTAYYVYDQHPGETIFGGFGSMPMSGQWVPASNVLHFFRPDRIGQLRGISEFAPSLNCGSQTRRFQQAALSAAERGAKISMVIETELAPDGVATPPIPFEDIPMSTDSVVALPAGSKAHGYDAVQPQAQYAEFSASNNAQWGLPVQAPRGVVSQDSSTYNFSSIRSDHLGFRDGMWVERGRVDCNLDKLWELWLRLLVTSSEPEAAQYRAYALDAELTVEWHWPGFSAIDPVKEASAVVARLDRGLTTLAEENAAEGKDWEQTLDQRGREIEREKEIGMQYAVKGQQPGRPAKADDDETDDETPLDPRPARGTKQTGRYAASLVANVVDENSLRCTAGGTATIEAAAGGQTGPNVRSISGVAYSGGPMLLEALGNVPAVVDLNGLEIPSGNTPLLRDHDRGRPVGHAKAMAQGGGIYVDGKLSGVGFDADKISAMADRGYPWQLSISGPFAGVDYYEAGRQVNVNGRLFAGPVQVVRKFTLREVSLVSVGADPATSAVIAAAFGGFDMTFEAWLQAQGVDANKLTDVGRANLQAAYNATRTPVPQPAPQPAPAPAVTIAAGAPAPQPAPVFTPVPPQQPAPASAVGTLDATMARHREELATVARIEGIIAAALESDRRNIDLYEHIAKTAIVEGKPAMTVDQVQNAVLQAKLSGPVPNPVNRSTNGSGQANGDVIEAAIWIQERLPNPDKRFNAQTLDAAHKHYPRGLGLSEVYNLQARQNGYHGSPRDIKAMMEAAFTRDLSSRVRGGWFEASGSSGIDTPNILSNVANKVLETRFLGGEMAYAQTARISSAKDFKQQTFLRLTGVGTFERIAPDGQIKHGTLGERSYTVTPLNYGKMLGIGYEMLRNDDLGAFTDVAAELGSGANEIVNNVYWDAFAAANTTLFPTDDSNRNYLNSSSIFNLTALDAAESKFRLQTKPGAGPNGETRLLGIMPSIILVPAAIGNRAAAAMGTPTVVYGGSTIAPDVNVMAGRYQVVSSAYMQDSMNSAVKWFLIANPQTLALMYLSFLDGIQIPVVEANPFDFNTLGQQWRSHFAFGVGTGEYRAGVYNTGAS